MTIKELSVTSLCLACGFALLPPESARANAPVTVPASVDGSALDAESANSPTIDATNDSTKPASAQKHDFEGTAVRQASGVPGTCPQPPPPAIPACTDLLDPDCLGGLPGEECRPTQVQLVGAQFVATVCDCIAPGDECGPIEVILSGDGIRCPGTCPPPNLPDDCHVHANGVSLGSPDAFVTDPDIPPLAFLTCECTEPVVVCPLPGDPAVDPCANLQSTDCTDPQAPDEVCRPRCVRFGAAGAFVETCDCRTSAECFADPVSLSCVADCPPDEECSETTTVNPDGSTTLCCDCVPVAGACCFDSDGDGINDDCMQLSIDECAAIGGAFHGAGTPCGGTGSCCLDLDGIPGFEACLPMDALCCADQMGQFTAGGVCLGTGACCFDTDGDGTFDTCSDMDGTCCANAGGVFQGAGTNCLDNPCVPPPDTCPEPPGQDFCAALQDTDCVGLATEQCRPTKVELVGNQFVATACDCIEPGDKCGPIDISPAGDALMCPGGCPAPNPPGDCFIHVNGISLDTNVAPIGHPGIFPGAELTCRCTEPVEACPLPSDPAIDPCAMLQDSQCTEFDTPSQHCFPRCVNFANGTVTGLQCDCLDQGECHVVVEPGVTPHCDGVCPPGEDCVETVTPNPVLGGVDICCTCEPAAGACCFDSDGDGLNDDCNQLSANECAAIGGTFHGAGTPCGGSGSCCLDLDGIPGFEACLPMDALCCADQMGQFTAGGVCLGTGACCFDTDGDGTFDTCSDMDGACCANAGGMFQGLGTSCADGACDPFCAPEPICEPLADTHCMSDDPTETCRPLCVDLADDGTGTPVPVATECGCISPDDFSCGPMQVLPFAGTPFFDLVCQAECLPPEAGMCQVIIDGVATGQGKVSTEFVPAGAHVCCECIEFPPPTCPEPADQDICAGLADEQCLSDDTTTTCEPLCVTIEGVGGVLTPVGKLCDCIADDSCGPIDVTPINDPPSDYRLSCEGLCEAGEICEVFIDGNPSGQVTIDASAVPVGSLVCCDCADDPPPPTCPLSADLLCEDRQAIDCPEDQAGELCQASCVDWDPLTGAVTASECGCGQEGDCHVVIGLGPLGDPICQGACADGTPCEPTAKDNADGTIRFCCGCCPASDLQVDLTTGVDDGTGAFIPIGSDDDTWTVTCEPGTGGVLPRPAQVIAKHPAWALIPGSQWVSANTSGPNGEYCYETCFCLDERARNPLLSLELLADDQATVFVNGFFLGQTPSPGFLVPTGLTTNDETLFLPGETNCITVVVENQFGVVTGFDLAGSLTVENGQCCCGPTDDGSACEDVDCPIAEEECQPRCLAIDPLTQEVTVEECECSGQDSCHPQVLPGAAPECVGGCPDGEECVETLIHDPATGAVIGICCDCEPAVEPCPEPAGSTYCAELQDEQCVSDNDNQTCQPSCVTVIEQPGIALELDLAQPVPITIPDGPTILGDHLIIVGQNPSEMPTQQTAIVNRFANTGPVEMTFQLVAPNSPPPPPPPPVGECPDDRQCANPDQCAFDGLPNISLGQAGLSITPPPDCNLVVSNIGSSGKDGVRQDPLPPGTKKMATGFQTPNFSLSQMGTEAQIDMLADVPGGLLSTMHVENINGQTLRVTGDISPAGVTLYQIIVILDGEVAFQASDLELGQVHMPKQDILEGVCTIGKIDLDIKECDCFDVDVCGPVQITPIGPTDPPQDYELACLGGCPTSQDCHVFVDGNSTGGASILASQVTPGSQVKCDCEAIGACCDHAQPGGVCIDGLTESECINDPTLLQPQWFPGQTCAAVEAAGLCEEHTGACCDGTTGDCTSEVPESECPVACFGECINGSYCDNPDCCIVPGNCVCYAPNSQISIELCGDCFGECVGGSYCDPPDPDCCIDPAACQCYAPGHPVSIKLCGECFGECINGGYCDSANDPDCCIDPGNCQCYEPDHPVSMKLCGNLPDPDNQYRWEKGIDCDLLDPPCEEHRGACCDGTTGICQDGVPESECGPPPGILNFEAVIDEAQAGACAGTGSAGTGIGLFTLDTTTGNVNYNISFSGLGSPETVSHVHGAAPVCINAGVVYGLPLGSPKIGVVNLTAAEAADMISGLHYVNVHTQMFPGGEIRGQIRLLPDESQYRWEKDTLCLELNPPCEEHTGACCDDEAGICEENVPESECPTSDIPPGIGTCDNAAACSDPCPSFGACQTNSDCGPGGVCVPGCTPSFCTCDQGQWVCTDDCNGQCAAVPNDVRWQKDTLCDELDPPCEGVCDPECMRDINGDGMVGATDLANLLGCWGQYTPGTVCECFDKDGDGFITASDLASLLGSWGPCP